MTANQSARFGCNCFTDPASIVNGLPVNADTINARLDALYQNDLYLKQVLDYFQMPSALIRCVEVNPLVGIGQPVYWSESTGRYELAQYQTVTVSGRTYLADTAEVWGIITQKESNDSALMLIDGIYPVDLTNSYGAATYSGKLYLSETPGILTANPPDGLAPVYVLSGTDNTDVLFRPWSGEYSGLLVQWKHSLAPVPAGTGVIADCRGSITGANSALPGWLPADDPSFNGKAPSNALFGYNISADSELADKWPPRYLETAFLDFDRGLTPNVGGTSVPLGANGLAIVDENGIWWLSDCVEDLPWTSDFILGSSGDCPRNLSKRLDLYAARPGTATTSVIGSGDTTLVSNHPAFRFVKENTDTLAKSGALELVFDPNSIIGGDDDTSSRALKSVNGTVIDTGPVVSGIKAGTGVSISSTDVYSTGEYGFGEVIVSAELAGQRELLPLTTAMRKATEERTEGSLGIGLPPRRESGITSMFQVPLDLSAPVTLSLRLWTVATYPSGSGGGGTEQLNVSYRVLSQPSPSTDLSTLDTQTLSIPASEVAASSVYEQQSVEFQANPGDVIYIDIDRDNQSVEYMMQVVKHFLYIESTAGAGEGTTTSSPSDCCNCCNANCGCGEICADSTTEAPTTTTTEAPTTTESPQLCAITSPRTFVVQTVEDIQPLPLYAESNAVVSDNAADCWWLQEKHVCCTETPTAGVDVQTFYWVFQGYAADSTGIVAQVNVPAEIVHLDTAGAIEFADPTGEDCDAPIYYGDVRRVLIGTDFANTVDPSLSAVNPLPETWQLEGVLYPDPNPTGVKYWTYAGKTVWGSQELVNAFAAAPNGTPTGWLYGVDIDPADLPDWTFAVGVGAPDITIAPRGTEPAPDPIYCVTTAPPPCCDLSLASAVYAVTATEYLGSNTVTDQPSQPGIVVGRTDTGGDYGGGPTATLFETASELIFEGPDCPNETIQTATLNFTVEAVTGTDPAGTLELILDGTYVSSSTPAATRAEMVSRAGAANPISNSVTLLTYGELTPGAKSVDITPLMNGLSLNGPMALYLFDTTTSGYDFTIELSDVSVEVTTVESGDISDSICPAEEPPTLNGTAPEIEFNNIPLNCDKLDIFIALDVTGSMRPWKSFVEDSIDGLSTALRTTTGGDYRFGLVTFRDSGDIEIVKTLGAIPVPGNLSSNADTQDQLLADSLVTVNPRGGGGAAEAAHEAIATAIAAFTNDPVNSPTRASTKVVILVSDVWAHGSTDCNPARDSACVFDPNLADPSPSIYTTNDITQLAVNNSVAISTLYVGSTYSGNAYLETLISEFMNYLAGQTNGTYLRKPTSPATPGEMASLYQGLCSEFRP